MNEKGISLVQLRQRKTRQTAALFLAPVIILLVVFIAYPIIDTFITSGYQWNGISADKKMVGLANWAMTSPVSIPAIVAGKFLAEVAVFALPLAAAVLMPLILKAFGTVSLVAAYSAVLGYLLLGSACLAVGTWISALTENQILAYLATFGALLVAYIMDGIQTMFTTGNLLAFIAFMVVVLIASILVGVICKRLTAGVTVFCVGAVVLFILFRLRPAWLLTAFNAVLSALALFDPFQDIVGGMFSIPAIVYYLSVIGLFLFLTGQALERRRWN